jgi:hypothetical protein
MRHQAKQNSVLRAEIAKPLQGGLLKAKRFKSKIVEPAHNQLQIDIDGLAQAYLYQLQMATLRAEGLTKGWKIKIKGSRQNGHIHATIDMPIDWYFHLYESNLMLLTKIGLQTLLGSDPRREVHNWCRVVKGNKYPIVFFERRKK